LVSVGEFEFARRTFLHPRPDVGLGFVVEDHGDLEGSPPWLLLVEDGLNVVDAEIGSVGEHRDALAGPPTKYLSGLAMLDLDLGNLLAGSWCRR